jgi:hypothetical protein
MSSTLVKVNYAGYAGSYMQPPECAELLIECEVSDTECDAYASEVWGGEVEVECAGDSTHGAHMTTVVLDDGPDPDDEYERYRDEQMGL